MPFDTASTAPTARPFFRNGTDYLATIVASNPAADTLAAIARELAHRNRPGARQLAATVAQLLASVAMPAPACDSAPVAAPEPAAVPPADSAPAAESPAPTPAGSKSLRTAFDCALIAAQSAAVAAHGDRWHVAFTGARVTVWSRDLHADAGRSVRVTDSGRVVGTRSGTIGIPAACFWPADWQARATAAIAKAGAPTSVTRADAPAPAPAKPARKRLATVKQQLRAAVRAPVAAARAGAIVAARRSASAAARAVAF